MKEAILTLLTICALSTASASMPDTYNVDSNGNVTKGAPKQTTSSTKKITAPCKIDLKIK
jgi:hypothetical protein